MSFVITFSKYTIVARKCSTVLSVKTHIDLTLKIVIFVRSAFYAFASYIPYFDPD